MDQGGSKVAGADENNRLKPGGAKHTCKLSLERLDLVSEAPRSELAKVCQILPELGRFDPSRLRQSSRRDRINPILEKSLDDSEVQRKPINGFPGDYKLRHL
jgi:hypothetical protein